MLDSQLLLAAVEASTESVLITDADLEPPGPRILYVNPACSRMTGYSPEELVGRTPRILQGPLTDPEVIERLRRDLRTIGSFHGQAYNHRKDGTPFMLEWAISGVRDEAGRLTHWIAVQRDVTERHQMELDREQLNRELQHRVKNTLTVAMAVAREAARVSRSVQSYQEGLEDRLMALAQTNDLLTSTNSSAISVRDLVDRELAPYGTERIDSRGDEVRLAGRDALMLAMAVHELATNAAKHGALSTGEGRVEVRWRQAEIARRLEFEWRETHGPPVRPPERQGFGSALLQHVAERGGDAAPALEFLPDGLRCRMNVRLQEPLADA